MTYFNEIIELAFVLITDDTFKGGLESYDEFLENGSDLLMLAIPKFRFPKFNTKDIVDLLEQGKAFTALLDEEEKTILAHLLAIEWVRQQTLTTELTRQEVYATSDYRKTSQASHMSRLVSLRSDLQKEIASLQTWYGRRTIGENGTVSRMVGLAGKSDV